MGYDNLTGKLTPIPDMKTGQYGVANYNLATIQGGAQVMFELVPLLGPTEAAVWHIPEFRRRPAVLSFADS